MYIADPNSPYYQQVNPNDNERGIKFAGHHIGKYKVETGIDLSVDFIQKGLFQGHLKDFGSDLRNGALLGRPALGLRTGYRYGLQGALPITGLMGAYSFATAPKGRRISSGVGTVVGGLLGATIGGAIGGLGGAVLGGALLSRPIESITSNTIDRFVDWGRGMSHPNLGGRYQDSEVAFTMRQRASFEMANSLSSMRQHLGNEAMLMHS